MFREEKEKIAIKKWLKNYSIFFFMLLLVSFSMIFAAKRSQIMVVDGKNQHLNALIYYGKYLREIIINFFTGKSFVPPQWDMALGEGSDIIQTLHYYVIGEPLTLLSVLAPSKFTWILYILLIYLRMYLAGLSFGYFCYVLKKGSSRSILVGALVYVFCYWTMLSATKHPFFLLPMIYFPLVIAGVEILIRGEKRSFLLTISVMLTAISNFYFFYMIVLLTVVYAFVRLIPLCFKDFKQAMIIVLRIVLYSLLGVLMSMAVMAPVIYGFLASDRSASKEAIKLWDSLSYYRKLPISIYNDGEYQQLGYSFAVIPMSIALFTEKKKHSYEKVLLFICLGILIFPAASMLLNGMAYSSNRWTWAMSLIVSWIVVLKFDDIFELEKKKRLIIAVISCVYVIYCVCMTFVLKIDNSMIVVLVQSVLFAAFIVMIVWEKAFADKKKDILFIIVVLSLAFNFGHGVFTALIDGRFVTLDYCIKGSKQDGERVKALAQKENQEDFFRYSGIGLSRNSNVNNGLSATSFDWSIASPYASKYRKYMGLTDGDFSYVFYGDSERTAVMALANVKYYYQSKGENIIVPYGFYEAENKDSYLIYKNQYDIPFGWVYDKTCNFEEWNKLNTVYKQDIYLDTLVLNDSQEALPATSCIDVDYNISLSDNVKQKKNELKVSKGNGKVVLEFDTESPGEYYLTFEGLYYKGSKSTTEFYLDFNDGLSKRDMKYHCEGNRYYYDRHDFAFMLGYIEEAGRQKVELEMTSKGTYSFDALKIVCQPMDKYDALVENCKTNLTENLEIGVNKITADVNSDKDGYLFLSLPYSKGWKAKVDGVECEILQANVAYSAIPITLGKHEIKLVYHTPFLLAGVIISLLAWGIFIFLIIYNKRKSN